MYSLESGDGDTVRLMHGDSPLWSIDCNGNPFFGLVSWPAARVVAIGAGSEVQLIDEENARLLYRIDLASGDVPDRFGQFGEQPTDRLFVLGWRNVVCVDTSLAVSWIRESVAVDGITWVGLAAGHVHLSAEIDPPGGWVPIALDAASGHEVSTRPSH